MGMGLPELHQLPPQLWCKLWVFIHYMPHSVVITWIISTDIVTNMDGDSEVVCAETQLLSDAFQTAERSKFKEPKIVL